MESNENEKKKKIIQGLLSKCPQNTIEERKKLTKETIANQIEEGGPLSFISPVCDGFCYIGQGGVKKGSDKFQGEALYEIAKLLKENNKDRNKFWNILFKGGEAQLTRQDGNNKTTKLPQLCHRIMVICFPDQLVDIARIEDLKTIAKWLGISLKDDNNYNKNWLELNTAVFEEIETLVGNNDELKQLDGLKQRISIIGWELKNYINMNIEKLLEKNKNLILTGAPGTGKSYMAKEIAKSMTGDDDNTVGKHYEMVQFHPSYDYTDFVEGMRPVKKDKNIGFEYKEGVFREFCRKAANDNTKDQKYVFIIDEINRGEANKIFGELFYSIDPDKRGTEGQIKTQYHNIYTCPECETPDDPFKDGFYVPENVYIIGTMNDIDRNVESIDFAFRRRFLWKEIKWDDTFDTIVGEIFKEDAAKFKVSRDNLKKAFDQLNKKIEKELGEAYCIGGSYAMKITEFLDEDKPLESLWNYFISNIVNEYIRGDESKKLDDYKNAFLKGSDGEKKTNSATPGQ